MSEIKMVPIPGMYPDNNSVYCGHSGAFANVGSRAYCTNCAAARIAELEAIVANLSGLLALAKCPDDHCDGEGSSWDVCADRNGDPEHVRVQCQWCDERTGAAALAARGSK